MDVTRCTAVNAVTDIEEGTPVSAVTGVTPVTKRRKSARTCGVCRHPDVDLINQALVTGLTLREITGKWEISRSTLDRHRARHIPEAVLKAKEAKIVAQGDDVLGSIRALHATTLKILREAEAAGEHGIALKAIKEARCNLELLAKLDGQLSDTGKVEIFVNYVDKAIIAPRPETREIRAISCHPVQDTAQDTAQQIEGK